MIRKIILSILTFVLFSSWGTIKAENTAVADSLKFGYYNSIEVLNLMPAKITAKTAIEELNQKYKDELLLMQNEYTRKYSDFMDNQASMSENIKLRRMQELQEIEENIKNFMKVAQEDIESQEEQQIKPLKDKLNAAVQAIGLEYKFICIYDLSSGSIGFITPTATDITPLLKKRLNITK